MKATSYMENLIPVVQDENDEAFISSRDLHNFLEVQTQFSVWISKMLKYGFVEAEDYKKIIKEIDRNGKKQTDIDYMINIDMAKEICTIQRSNKGRKARRYFINVEKKLNSPEQFIYRLLELSKTLKNKRNIIEEDNVVSKDKTYLNEELNSNINSLPKVNFQQRTNSLRNINTENTNTLMTNFRDTAKLFGIKESLFINWLLLNNYCYRDSKDIIKPYAKYMNYFSFRPYVKENGHCGIQTLINQQGRDVFQKLLTNENIIKNTITKYLN